MVKNNIMTLEKRAEVSMSTFRLEAGHLWCVCVHVCDVFAFYMCEYGHVKVREQRWVSVFALYLVLGSFSVVHSCGFIWLAGVWAYYSDFLCLLQSGIMDACSVLFAFFMWVLRTQTQFVRVVLQAFYLQTHLLSLQATHIRRLFLNQLIKLLLKISLVYLPRRKRQLCLKTQGPKQECEQTHFAKPLTYPTPALFIFHSLCLGSL